MNKTLLILRHEFLHTVKRKGFIIMTLIVPLGALLAIGVVQLVSGITKPTVEITTIGYVDESGGFQQYTSQENITLVRLIHRMMRLKRWLIVILKSILSFHQIMS